MSASLDLARAALHRRPIALAVAAVTAGGLGGTLLPHLPLILWNTTASAPLGAYRVLPIAHLSVGEWVVARPPPELASWLAERRYLPANVPLLKQVAAVGGQAVCRESDSILVDGRLAARARMVDQAGAPLPTWRGCRRLGAGEFLLLNAPRDSLDGRYFGVTRSADLVGRARPLWTWRTAR